MLIGISGKAGSGKSTMAEYLRDKYGYTILSFADPVRAMLYELNPWIDHGTLPLQEPVDLWGWDYVKRNYSEVRELLQRMGTEAGRGVLGEDVWVRAMGARLFALPEAANVVIPDVRFLNEVTTIEGQNGSVVRIEAAFSNGHSLSVSDGHVSETELDNRHFRHVVHNDGTLDDLYKAIDGLMECNETTCRYR